MYYETFRYLVYEPYRSNSRYAILVLSGTYLIKMKANAKDLLIFKIQYWHLCNRTDIIYLPESVSLNKINKMICPLFNI